MLSTPRYCQNPSCGSVISPKKYGNIYCNHSCRAQVTNRLRNPSPATRLKWSEAAKKQPRTRTRPLSLKEQASGPYTVVYRRICQKTGLAFYAKSNNAVYCSDAIKQDAVAYRQACLFRFKPESIKDVLDCSLLEQYGRYHPQTNKHGAVLDHLFTVADGFKLGIDPSIIRHPANCQWLLQKQNQSKGPKSSITYDELLKRISDWDGDPAEN